VPNPIHFSIGEKKILSTPSVPASATAELHRAVAYRSVFRLSASHANAIRIPSGEIAIACSRDRSPTGRPALIRASTRISGLGAVFEGREKRHNSS